MDICLRLCCLIFLVNIGDKVLVYVSYKFIVLVIICSLLKLW